MRYILMYSHCTQRNYIYFIYNPVIDLKMTSKISRRLDNCWRYFHRKIPCADLQQTLYLVRLKKKGYCILLAVNLLYIMLRMPLSFGRGEDK